MFQLIMSATLAAALLVGCGTKPQAALASSVPQGNALMTAAATRAAGLPAEVSVATPTTPGKHPLLVIAPAKEYTMAGPLFLALEAGAVAQGYKVVRFNWGFVTRKDQPSADLKAENAELAQVLDHFSKAADVDGQRVVLAAKSFGSRVAMNGAFKKASALLLMTPNSNAQAPFERNYAPLFGWGRPIHVVIAATDPYGDLGQLYTALPKLGKNTTATVLPVGDHNFKVDGPGSALNERVGLDASLNWLAQGTRAAI